MVTRAPYIILLGIFNRKFKSYRARVSLFAIIDIFWGIRFILIKCLLIPFLAIKLIFPKVWIIIASTLKLFLVPYPLQYRTNIPFLFHVSFLNLIHLKAISFHCSWLIHHFFQKEWTLFQIFAEYGMLWFFIIQNFINCFVDMGNLLGKFFMLFLRKYHFISFPRRF